MTHLYDSYLFESGRSGGGGDGDGDGDGRGGRLPAEIRPQRMPGLPHATTKQTLNRGRRGSRGNLTIPSFFLFSSITHGTNDDGGGEISLFLSFFFLLCDVHRGHSTSFFFLFYRPSVDMLPRGVTDRFVPKSGNILADFSRY